MIRRWGSEKESSFPGKRNGFRKRQAIGKSPGYNDKKNKIWSPHLRHPRALSSKDGYCQRKVGIVGGEIKKNRFQVEK